MRTSDQIDLVATALAKAQAAYPPIRKTRTARLQEPGRGPGLEYRYADLADVLQAVLPVLSKEGLAVLQPTFTEGGHLWIRTRLVHSSGQWIESDYPVFPIGADHQKIGAALTYARRYALCSLLGITAEDDTDGQPVRTGEPSRAAAVSAKSPSKYHHRTVLGPVIGKPLPLPIAGHQSASAGGRLPRALSAGERDKLLDSLQRVDSTPALGDWASKKKAARDRLTARDATSVTRAFKARKLSLTAETENSVEPLKTPTFEPAKSAVVNGANLAVSLS